MYFILVFLLFFYIEKILQHTKQIYTNHGQLCICKINKYKYGYSVNIFYR
uniref:Putative ORF20 protein n=1 Tax=Swinepox virus TaxID=10276 RepID=A0A7M1RRV8_SWPV|nr:putative ORF20 protein [Swinepox virus]